MGSRIYRIAYQYDNGSDFIYTYSYLTAKCDKDVEELVQVLKDKVDVFLEESKQPRYFWTLIELEDYGDVQERVHG